MRRLRFERLRRLAPMIDRLLVAAESARMIAVVDPAAATEVARRLSDRFADTPFAALAGIDPRRWLELLAPWEGCGEMALVVGGPGEGTRAWLERWVLGVEDWRDFRDRLGAARLEAVRVKTARPALPTDFGA